MTRSKRTTWIVFWLCVLLVVDVLAWVSIETLALERRERQARQEADEHERIRLALWRMDSAIAPIVAGEASRPPFHYRAFYPVERAYTRMFESVGDGEVVQASPLLSEAGAFIRLHFEIAPDGQLTSPQAPGGTMQDLAESRFLRSPEQITRARVLLLQLEGLLAQRGLGQAPSRGEGENRLGMLIERDDLQRAREIGGLDAQVGRGLTRDLERLAAGQDGADEELGEAHLDSLASKESKDESAEAEVEKYDFAARRQVFEQAANIASPYAERSDEKSVLSVEASVAQPAPGVVLGPGAPGDLMVGGALLESLTLGDVADVALGAFEPIWRHDPSSGSSELMFVRRVSISGDARTQGFWVDWPALRAELLNRIVDQLPQADVSPANVTARGDRLLASIPAVLIPTSMPRAPLAFLTPARMTLAVAWVATIVSIVAIGVVLRAAMSLSERRGRFVSAVTHELRTPMTTFRMYSEMLASGMVREDKRQRYLDTLRDEAARLGRIVETVLAYARLDRAADRRSVGAARLGTLLDSPLNSLRRQASSCGADLSIDIDPDARDALVPDDAEAIERILGNLLDNACKYGRDDADRVRIELRVSRQGQRVRLRVRDFGPGIRPEDASRVFAAFDRGAHEGDSARPGLGLGLSLARGLARSLAGDLSLARDADIRGAVFDLFLPIVR